MMNSALWAAIIAAQQANQSAPEPYVDRTWRTEESTLPRWPRFLLWIIRRRTHRRHAGKTWAKLDDWLWDKYFASIEP